MKTHRYCNENLLHVVGVQCAMCERQAEGHLLFDEIITAENYY
jgi:hypothetical protein